MPIVITRITDLDENQAWWCLCAVMNNAANAARAIDRARIKGRDWGTLYHITYLCDVGTFDVMLLPAMG